MTKENLTDSDMARIKHRLVTARQLGQTHVQIAARDLDLLMMEHGDMRRSINIVVETVRAAEKQIVGFGWWKRRQRQRSEADF